ncbi:hypothetical protein [Nitrospira sp. M1]
MYNATVVKFNRKALLNTLQQNPEIAIQSMSNLWDSLSEAHNIAKGFTLDFRRATINFLVGQRGKESGNS